MVTQVDYADVPDFCAEHGEAWPSGLGEWLHTLGLGLLMFGKNAPEYVPSWLPIIAQGKTDRSPLLHFVVVTADSIIDPSPYQSGLTEITDRYAIVNSGALANGFIEHLAKEYATASRMLRAHQSATPSQLAAQVAERAKSVLLARLWEIQSSRTTDETPEETMKIDAILSNIAAELEKVQVAAE